MQWLKNFYNLLCYKYKDISLFPLHKRNCMCEYIIQSLLLLKRKRDKNRKRKREQTLLVWVLRMSHPCFLLFTFEISTNCIAHLTHITHKGTFHQTTLGCQGLSAFPVLGTSCLILRPV